MDAFDIKKEDKIITIYDSELADDNTIMMVPHKSLKNCELCNSDDVVKFMKDVFNVERLAEENLFCMCLNIRMRCNAVFCVSRGTSEASLLDTRSILVKSLLLNASSIILIHNHPAGSCVPSTSDVEATIKVKEACQTVGIHLADHLVISSFLGDGNYYSFANETELLKCNR